MKVFGRRQLVALLSMTIGLSMGSIAGAETPDAEVLDGEALFNQRTCFTCHGKDGKTPLLPFYPIIAGQNAAYALQQMKDIKSGARANGNSAAMQGVMFLVNDEEMKILADYISTLER
jgi:cytochrome c